MLEAASAQQRNAILPAVARGEIILSVAITDPNTSWGPQAVTLRPQRLGDRFRLDGTKLFVSDATAATHLIVAVRTGDGPADVSLLMVDARSMRFETLSYAWDETNPLSGATASITDLSIHQ